MINRLRKFLTAAATPAFWPALVKGVMPTVEHVEAIQRLAPNTLIDIGANKGQFSVMAQRLFPTLEIHAFEPLERARAIYKSVLGASARVYPMALGSAVGEATFFVTTRADSSSLLQPASGQERAYGVGTNTSILIPVARLSDVIHIAALKRPILMKIDVQGGELDVLRGGEGDLRFIDMIYCEASFVELYRGQPLAAEIIAYLAARHFDLRGVFNLSLTREFGPTQADFLFLSRAEDAQSR